MPYPNIQSTPPYAADCCRIEFKPSPAATAAWLIWLCAALSSIWLSELPLIWRWLLAALVAVALLPLHRFVMLQGRHAVRALEWTGQEFHVWLGTAGHPGRRLPAVPTGCRRYGAWIWLLDFDTAEGKRGLLIVASRQDPQAMRRLVRRLQRASGSGLGLPVGEKLIASRPKV